MIIDPTLTVGALINAGVLLVGFIVAFTRIGGRIDLLAARLKAVEDGLTHMRDVNERLAIIETRQATHGQMIANQMTDLQNLKTGRGFIQPRREPGVEGEY